jgi:hypothetical protein
MNAAAQHLPKQILDRASLRGKEYAWRIADIPAVIEAARKAGFVNIGGQLQFRIPDGGTCECYWVKADTYKAVSKVLPWNERVNKTADAALAEFTRLASQYDFLEEGRRAFGAHLKGIEERGESPTEAMCFVWCLLGAQETAQTQR